MVNPVLKIGKKVRIISKANVRYEGTFVEIDVDKLQIALCEVQFFGTENRDAEVFFAGQSTIYPFVVFSNTDIKEIVVLEEANMHTLHCGALALEVSCRMSAPLESANFSHMIRGLNGFDGGLQHKGYLKPEPTFFNSRLGSENCRSSFPRPANTSHYMWRIPRVVDYIGRSGDPNELPLETVGKFSNYEQDYDFEKYNKLFVDLCGGLIDLSLTTANNNNNTSASAVDNSSVNLSADSGIETANESDLKKRALEYNDEDASAVNNECEHINASNEKVETETEENSTAIATPANFSLSSSSPVSNHGAIPKQIIDYDLLKNKSNMSKSTAYDKSKSFFDTVSCSSMYRTGIFNPNWREHNTETFGVAMIYHQRRPARYYKREPKEPVIAEEHAKQQKSGACRNDVEKCVAAAAAPLVTNNAKRHHYISNSNNMNHAHQRDSNKMGKVSNKKVHFKDVNLTKNNKPKATAESNTKQIQTEPVTRPTPTDTEKLEEKLEPPTN